jgi:hypothetical protein
LKIIQKQNIRKVKHRIDAEKRKTHVYTSDYKGVPPHFQLNDSPIPFLLSHPPLQKTEDIKRSRKKQRKETAEAQMHSAQSPLLTLEDYDAPFCHHRRKIPTQALLPKLRRKKTGRRWQRNSRLAKWQSYLLGKFHTN